MLQVEAEIASAAPPTMAAFSQPAQSAGGAPGGTPGGMPMGTPVAGMPMGMGTPVGGNMFARQSRSGARSRYVDTLNPNASDATPVFCFLCARPLWHPLSSLSVEHPCVAVARCHFLSHVCLMCVVPPLRTCSGRRSGITVADK